MLDEADIVSERLVSTLETWCRTGQLRWLKNAVQQLLLRLGQDELDRVASLTGENL